MKKEEFNKLLKTYKRRKRFYFGRGVSFLEAGFVYAPYIPVQLTPVIHDCEILHNMLQEADKVKSNF
jgi:hypothetical protein